MKSLKGIACFVMVWSAVLPVYAISMINWNYSGSLAVPIPSVANGWLVEVYRDVGANTTLSAITAFDTTGLPQGDSASVGDDVKLTSASVSGTTWASSIGGSYTGSKAYTVVFNSSTFATATQAWIIDTLPATLPSAGSTYTPNGTPSTVGYGPLSVVPEPSTLLLLGLGSLVVGLRRRLSAARP